MSHLPVRPRPIVFAHRGFSCDYPENTLCSFSAALELDVDGCECDVHLSKDGVAFLLHDDSLKRTTGCETPVDELSYAEIATLDAGSWKDPKFAGEPVPTLVSALELHRGRGIFLVEIKAHGDPGRMAQAVVDAVVETDTLADTVVFSFGLEHAAAAAQRLPGLSCLWLHGKLPEADGWDGLFATTVSHRLLGLAPHFAAVTPKFVRAAHRRGLTVWVWTVNDRGAFDHAMACGADAIISDTPDQVLEWLA